MVDGAEVSADALDKEHLLLAPYAEIESFASDVYLPRCLRTSDGDRGSNPRYPLIKKRNTIHKHKEEDSKEMVADERWQHTLSE